MIFPEISGGAKRIIIMNQFAGYHSEWNLGSPGGWDYQRIVQEVGKAVWMTHFQSRLTDIHLDFDHPLLHPVNGFVNMLKEACCLREGTNTGFIAVVAEEETLKDVVENRNLVAHLNTIDGMSSALMAPHELEQVNDRVCWRGHPVSIIFMDFNTNILLDLHRKHNLYPLLQAVKETRVINPRGTEPINAKSMFEVITDPKNIGCFHEETIKRTPWTRQFYPRQTQGPDGEHIPDLVEWTRSNWDNLVLKPERGYSGKGVYVGGINQDIDAIIRHTLIRGDYGDYIVQEKVPLNLWTENIPELDLDNHTVREVQQQTDFRCFIGPDGLFGFVGRYGGIPTNVGSGGGMQPLAVLHSEIGVGETTERINQVILSMDYSDMIEAVELQQKMALDRQFTYLLGPIKIALRPRLITPSQVEALNVYCTDIWSDCLILEKMWLSGDLGVIVNIEPEELEIIRSQPWMGSRAIFASDGLFSFGAHVE
ncbi:hypothetical protein ACFLW4_02525 [Chloroflexota bacterium]